MPCRSDSSCEMRLTAVAYFGLPAERTQAVQDISDGVVDRLQFRPAQPGANALPRGLSGHIGAGLASAQTHQDSAELSLFEAHSLAPGCPNRQPSLCPSLARRRQTNVPSNRLLAWIFRGVEPGTSEKTVPGRMSSPSRVRCADQTDAQRLSSPAGSIHRREGCPRGRPRRLGRA